MNKNLINEQQRQLQPKLNFSCRHYEIKLGEIWDGSYDEQFFFYVCKCGQEFSLTEGKEIIARNERFKEIIN